jgi:hypothetical protein
MGMTVRNGVQASDAPLCSGSTAIPRTKFRCEETLHDHRATSFLSAYRSHDRRHHVFLRVSPDDGVGHSDYPMMIVGIYATLGVFLLLAARDPMEHLSLIWFAIWSSVVHGLIMTYQALTDVGQHEHLMGDVPALFLIAVVLAVLTPRNRRTVGHSSLA